MAKIYESPDGGQTVYEREPGSKDRRLTEESKRRHDEMYATMQDNKLWGAIRRLAQTNPTMKAELDRVIMLYKLIKEEQ